MRKAIETLKNIWKIEDLRHRILITICLLYTSYINVKLEKKVLAMNESGKKVVVKTLSLIHI